MYRDLSARGYRTSGATRWALDWEDAGLPLEGFFASPPAQS